MPFITAQGEQPDAGADVCQRMCKKEACAIQACLARWDYDQKRCQVVVTAWDRCCDAARKRDGGRTAGGPVAAPLPRR